MLWLRNSSQSFEKAHATEPSRCQVKSFGWSRAWRLPPETMQMSITDVDDDAEQASHPPARVGYGCPPVHSQFKPGQSGNPSGRAKGNQNLKTLFNKVLNEEISLRDGADVKRITKAEAVVRGVVVGALKGDPRNMAMLLRLAEQAGQFQDGPSDITEIRRVIVRWQGDKDEEADAV